MRSHGLRLQTFQPIFVMQSRQDRRGHDSVAIRNPMPVPPCGRAERRVGNAGTEVGVWSPLGVVSDPLQQNGPKMALIQQNQPIQTLTTDCADQSLAER